MKKKRSMARKTTEAPARVYSYGCSYRGVVANGDLVDDQYRKAHIYQQKLVELELTRRRAVRTVLATDAGVAAALETIAAQEALLAPELLAASAVKQATKSKNLPPDLRTRIAQIKQQLNAARAALKVEKKRAAKIPSIEEALDQTSADHTEAIKAARATDDVPFWGTYLILERAAKQQRQDVHDPRFREYTGEGRIAVQFQKGATVERIFSDKDTRMRIEPLSKKRHMCKIRIGSTGRAPIWAEIEVFIHRALPADGRITWAWLRRIRRGRDYIYNLQITVESMSFVGAPPAGSRPYRRIGVDLGWRVAERGNGGLRVAYWHDSDGTHGELRIPPPLLSALDYPSQLFGVETNWFERAKTELLAWRLANALPEEHALRSASLAQWRSAQRLAGYVWWWREHRFAGDEAIFAAMNEWRVRRFWHYRDWSLHQRDKTLAKRKDFYRVWASQLVVDCKELVLEKLDLRDFSTKDDDNAPNATAKRYWKMQGCPSELRLCLIAAATKVGAKITMMNPAMTTRRCHACGSEQPWDQEHDVTHTCEACGVVWDQDDNAGINLLALASGSVTNEPPEALDHEND